MMSYSAGQAHENGDCWAPTCPACQIEDEMQAGEV